MRFFELYQNFRPFSDREAWSLFRIAAIAEAIGWTLLIIGIICRDVFGLGHAPVAVAGRIHGMLFVAYIVATLALSPSMRWPFWRMLLAGACSVPPYGSLVYEQISGLLRNNRDVKQFSRLTIYNAYAIMKR
jgi:integral membrane protein